jgi:uncharacterized membrane protein
MMLMNEALAGHAGEGSLLMSPEVMGAVGILIFIGIVLLVLGALGIWFLVRIERRLRRLESRDSSEAHSLSPPR